MTARAYHTDTAPVQGVPGFDTLRPAAVDAALLPAVVADSEAALTERAEHSVMDQLAKMEQAAAIFQRRCELLDTCHIAAIRRTRPEDWVLFRDKQSNEVAMLTGPGADLVAELYGVCIRNLRPVDDRGCFAPEKIVLGAGVYSYRATFDAFARINGRAVENMEAERRSDEDFTGRLIDKDGKFAFGKDAVAALDADLRASVARLAMTKAVRILCGMSRVPRSELDRAWKDSGKTSEQCRKGSGYGTSQDRQAQGASNNTAAAGEAEALWKQILARTGGDDTEAKNVLKAITSFTGKDGKAFPGYDSWQRITSDRMLAMARKRLAEHPVYGDDALAGAE